VRGLVLVVTVAMIVGCKDTRPPPAPPAPPDAPGTDNIRAVRIRDLLVLRARRGDESRARALAAVVQ